MVVYNSPGILYRVIIHVSVYYIEENRIWRFAFEEYFHRIALREDVPRLLHVERKRAVRILR